MGRKFEIEKNSGKKPNPEKLKKSQDFKKLMANYDQTTKMSYKKRIYKDPKVFLVILIVLIVLWVLWSVN